MLSRVLNINFNKVEQKDSKPQKQIAFKGLQNDTFERSKNIYSMESILAELPDDIKETLYENFETDEELSDFFDKYIREKHLEAYITAISSLDTYHDAVKVLKRPEALREFNRRMDESGVIDMGTVNRTLKSNGFFIPKQIVDYRKVSTQNKRVETVFHYMQEEGIAIYSKLRVKENLANFPDLLLHMYMEEEESENPDFENLNRVMDFLALEGVHNVEEFKKSFSELGEDFNNFRTRQDVIDGIIYAWGEYKEKISQLDEIVNPDGDNKRDAKAIFDENKELFEYIFTEYSGYEAEEINKISDYVCNKKKLKFNPKSPFAKDFNNFKTPKDKLDFCKLLNLSKISLTELSELEKINIKDIDAVDKILYKDKIVDSIVLYKNCSIEKANDIFRNNNEILTIAASLDSDDENEHINIMIEFIDNFKIKNINSFLNLYNTFNKTKEKNLTKEKVLEFIELTKFYEGSNALEKVKNTNKAPVDILKERKELFDKIKDDLDDYLTKTEHQSFINQNASDIFNKYYELFVQDNNVKGVLDNIKLLKTENIEQMQEELSSLRSFDNIFENHNELIDFIKDNGIKLDNSVNSTNYREMCLEILKQIKHNAKDDNETFKNSVENLTKSKFLKNSKTKIYDFKEKLLKHERFDLIADIIVNKNPKSVSNIVEFLDDTKGKNNKTTNIVETLAKCPENIDFVKFKKILSDVQKVASKYAMNIKVDNDNISKFDVVGYRNKDLSDPKVLANVLCKLIDAPYQDNFLRFTKKGTTTKEKHYSPTQIVLELLTTEDHVDTAYGDIKKFLGIKDYNDTNGDLAEYTYYSVLSKSLPEKFVNFVNSVDWHTLEDGKIVNLGLHAKLRIIGRFAIEEGITIDELCSDKTKAKLNKLINKIYTKSPHKIKENKKSSTFVTYTKYDNDVIKTVFSNKGEMITMFPKV